MATVIRLNDAQEHAITNALYHAAEVYRTNVATNDLGPRLREQFERQAREAEHLARLIENGALQVRHGEPSEHYTRRAA